MKGEKMAAVLGKIEEGAGGMIDLLIAFLNAGYGASFSGLQFEYNKLQRERSRRSLARIVETEKLQRYYNLISYLKRDGLIREEKKENRFHLTTKGALKLKNLRRHFRPGFPDVQKLSKIVGAQVIIVSYDVPERERAKRHWLSAALFQMGLRRVQQSLWIGKGILPKEFLDDLRLLKLADAVEIFTVNKVGSLRHVL